MISTYLCREHPIQCDADLIRSMSEEEWAAYVAGKYPDFDGELGDFTSSENEK